MTTVLLVIHLLLAIGLVGTILIQRSEGGALSGLGGGMSGFMTGRSTANLLTRATAILATGFFITSITLAIIANQKSEKRSILDQPTPAGQTQTAPAAPATPTPAVPAASDSAPATPAPAAPAAPAAEAPKPAEPSAPLAK